MTVGSLLLALVVSGIAPADGEAVADTIYRGGDIVTVVDDRPSAEALAVKDGRILAIGGTAEVMKHRGESTRVVDLGGRTLLPGFIDGHSHFAASLQITRMANCSAPPAGPARSIADILRVLKEFQTRNAIPAGEFVIGYGYDPDQTTDGRLLSAADLDAVFPDRPVFVQHVSMHGAVCNTLALRKFKIDKNTPTPPGGVIVRKPNSTEPEGLLMEAAWLPVFLNMPKPGEEEMLSRFKEGQALYAAAGITTAQEGATGAADLELIAKAAKQGLLFIDVVAYPFIAELKEITRRHPFSTFGKYDGHLKLGGVKITADGSPQGRTAYFSEPYLTGGPGGEKNWRGEFILPQAELDAAVKEVYDAGVQLFIHCNGDGAIDMFLKAHENASPNRSAERRSTVIHSQFVRPDQLKKYAEYRILASFFTEHSFFFGDTHVRNLGPARASFLSPMKTAIGMGIRCSNHTDFAVSPIDQLFVMWTAVTRESRSGRVLGPEERITPLQALKALTIEPAYIYGEEKTKGTLEVGKLADLVILDGNPLKVEPSRIKELKVLETIKEGRTIHKAK